MSIQQSTVIPAARYRDAKKAIEWLCTVIGFERHAVYEGDDGSVMHAELKLGGGMFMLGSTKDDEYGKGYRSPDQIGDVETRSVFVVVEDLDAVYARANAAGAKIIRPLQDTPYGSREFAMKDSEGHSWGIGNYNPWTYTEK